MNDYRIEKDFLGNVRVPKDAYGGAKTQRAIGNLSMSGIVFPPILICSLAVIKQACASVNHELHILDSRLAHAIA